MNYLINEPVSIEDIDFNHINDDIPRHGDGFDYNGETSNWCVYVHINKINNKMYFGVSSNLKDRWYNNGAKYKGCKVFYNAIQKYGFDSFKHFVLMNGLTETIAKAIENYLIIKYHSFAEDETGYNVLHDQSNPFSNTHDDNFHIHSTSAIPIHQYDMNGIYIQSFSCLNEAMMTVKGNYIGDSIKKCLSREHPFAYGFLWSLELVDQMEPYRPNDSKYWDEYHKADNKHGAIIQLNKDGSFVKRHKNINYINVSVNKQAQIIQCCLNNYVTTNDYIWLFEKDYNDKAVSQRLNRLNEIQHFKYNNKMIHPRSVIQYDTDGNKISEFDSIKQAAEAVGVHMNVIDKVCVDEYGSAAGFQWRYSSSPAPGKLHLKPPSACKPVIRIDDNQNEVLYESILAASKANDISDYRIKKCINGVYDKINGYSYKFA